MATVRTDRAFNRKLARQAKPAVKNTAEEIGARAAANLAGHRRTGSASIKVEHGPVDSHVILDDENSLSIEYGHGAYTTKGGREVGASEGLHVLGRAVHGG